jgi:CheY-like chemotaxis protein
MLKMLLETQGCTVFAAENGLKGLAVIEQHQPDVAIVDIGLPGLSGYDVARQVRATPTGSAPYLVALTGYGRASDIQKALDAGFDTHLVKPLDLSKLQRILEFQSRRVEAAAQ